MYSAFLNDCLLFCLLFLDPEICKIHVCKVPREKTTSMRWTAKRLQKASNSFQYETNANYYFIFKLDVMRDFTWGDLDGLFLGFEEELLPSGKKKPDILFLLPRENWAPNFIGILYYKSYNWSNEVSCQPITRRELSYTFVCFERSWMAMEGPARKPERGENLKAGKSLRNFAPYESLRALNWQRH